MYDIDLILSQVTHWEGNAVNLKQNAFSEDPICNYAQFTKHFQYTLVVVFEGIFGKYLQVYGRRFRITIASLWKQCLVSNANKIFC